MTPNTAAAPWKGMPFYDYALENGFSKAALDGILGFVAAKKEIKTSSMDELDDLFLQFMGDDISLASLSRMITMQGYETVNHMNEYIETYLDGHPSRIYVNVSDVPSPTGRFRFVSCGPWNVSSARDVDRYPLFCLGTVRSLDPMFN